MQKTIGADRISNIVREFSTTKFGVDIAFMF